MPEHHGSVTVHAPVQQVYSFFSHFNDFPKFMSFVKEVTYYDDQRSHWVVQIAGTHEWDAINDNWLPERQIGWHSTNGLKNRGLVKFTPLSNEQTLVDAYISYESPAGALGKAAEHLGFVNLEETLQHDLENFAQAVEQAPAGALDPMQSSYLFHKDSAVAKHTITNQQAASMRNDPMMNEQALQQRDEQLRQEQTQQQQLRQQEEESYQQRVQLIQQTAAQQAAALSRQAAINSQEAAQQQETNATAANAATPPDPVHDTIGGRNASKERTAFGERDPRVERFPGHQTDPMTSRHPTRDNRQTTSPSLADTKIDSPWRTSIRGDDSPEARAAREQQQDQVIENENRQQNQS